MKITEALELEVKVMQTRDKEYSAYQRDDVTQIIFGALFKDGKYFWLLPSKDITEKMALELSAVSRESIRWETRSIAKEGYTTASKNGRFATFIQNLLSWCIKE